MTTTRMLATALCLCLSLPMAAQAGPSDPGVGDEVRQELADARKDVRTDLAKARQELQTENLRLGQNFQFGDHGAKSREVPDAEITPGGDFLIDGKAQPIDAGQRRQLLAYRKQVVDIALDGIDAGQVAADAALDAVGGSWVGILFNAMTGRLEHRVERAVKQHIEPMVLGICKQLPAVMDSQQQLAGSLPSFKPYADLDQHDIDDCEGELRNEFASN